MVVYAKVTCISPIWYFREGEESNYSVDQFIEKGFVPVEMTVLSSNNPSNKGGDVYGITLLKSDNLDGEFESGEDGRGTYFINDFTMEEINKVLKSIEDKVNKLWGNNWEEVTLKVSWFGLGEWEFIYDEDPILNPDGTINYDPSAYMSKA